MIGDGPCVVLNSGTGRYPRRASTIPVRTDSTAGKIHDQHRPAARLRQPQIVRLRPLRRRRRRRDGIGPLRKEHRLGPCRPFDAIRRPRFEQFFSWSSSIVSRLEVRGSYDGRRLSTAASRARASINGRSAIRPYAPTTRCSRCTRRCRDTDPSRRPAAASPRSGAAPSNARDGAERRARCASTPPRV